MDNRRGSNQAFDKDDIKQLEKNLKEERDSIVAQCVGLCMLGKVRVFAILIH